MILVPTVRIRIPQCGTPYKIQTQPDKTLLNQKHFRTPSSSSDDVVGARRAHQEHDEVIDAALTIVSAHNVSGPLFVFENNGGSISEYFCALPRREWVGYFSSRIKIPPTKRKRKRKP